MVTRGCEPRWRRLPLILTPRDITYSPYADPGGCLVRRSGNTSCDAGRGPINPTALSPCTAALREKLLQCGAYSQACLCISPLPLGAGPSVCHFVPCSGPGRHGTQPPLPLGEAEQTCFSFSLPGFPWAAILRFSYVHTGEALSPLKLFVSLYGSFAGK